MSKYNYFLGKTNILINEEINEGYFDVIKQNLLKYDKVLVVIDKNVAKLYPQISSKFLATNYKLIVGESGEQIKTVDSYINFLSIFAKESLKRNDCVLVVGGGTLSDVVGFAVSTFKRGLKFCMMPTTFLSMIDSCLGGKNGINFEGKNMVGTFYEPDAVYINLNFLKTLPQKEILSGYGELLKYVLLDKSFCEYFLKTKKHISPKIIKMSLRVKYKYFSKDVLDMGMRKNLNLGHTFAHAIEEKSKYMIPHGVAVLYGLKFVLDISMKKLGGITQYKEINEVFNNFQVNNISCNIQELLPLMYKDKKNSNENFIELILLKDIGEPLRCNFVAQELLEICHGNFNNK